MKKFLVLPLLLPFSANAFESRGTAQNYAEAKRAASFLKFEYPVRKLFFGAMEDGYVTKFIATAKIDGHRLIGPRVEFEAHDLDTDIFQRNDILWNKCLSYKEFPKLRVTIPPTEFTEGVPVRVNATMNIRGKDKPLVLELTMTKENGKWVAVGKALSSFDSLGIPDPSIGVAAVKGPIELTFRLLDQ